MTVKLPGRAILAAVGICAALLASACGSSSTHVPPFGVTIAPIATGSPAVHAAAVERIGGKPAAPSVDASGATQAPESADSGDDTPVPESPASDATDGVVATPTPATPLASDGSRAPDSGRWIDVNVSTFDVRLMDGKVASREIAPVAVGTDVDTGAFTSTQTGLFHVYNKIEDLAYDPPYDTYISDWVGFDLDKANGFHSFLKDKTGKVVNPATGRISNGCIRTGASAAVYAYAEIGMPVWVHR